MDLDEEAKQRLRERIDDLRENAEESERVAHEYYDEGEEECARDHMDEAIAQRKKADSLELELSGLDMKDDEDLAGYIERMTRSYPVQPDLLEGDHNDRDQGGGGP